MRRGFGADILGREHILYPLGLWPIKRQTAFLRCLSQCLSFTGAKAPFIGNASTTSDFWGTNAGGNYAMRFTAWGVAGMIGSYSGGQLFDKSKNFLAAFKAGAALCLSRRVRTLGQASNRTESAEFLGPFKSQSHVLSRFLARQQIRPACRNGGRSPRRNLRR